MKKIFFGLFILIIVIVTSAYLGWDVFNLFGSNKYLDTKELYKQSVDSVVSLTVTNLDGGCNGTGFFALEPDIIATCYHVVNGATSITAKDSKGNEYQIEGIIDYSESFDIAILKSSKKGKMLNLDANLPSPGTNIYALGNPMGLNFSFTNGMVSQIQNLSGTNIIQFSAPISPGNSGGPLLSENGKVLGIVSSYFTKGQNLNFAVPVAMMYTLNKTKTPKYEDSRTKKLYNLFMKDMVLCPAGSFIMGSPENELGREDKEIQHKVTISRPFYIGKYEITQSLYEIIIGSCPKNLPSQFKGENYPVSCVSWYEAKRFCEKLNILFKDFLPNGYYFALPTEAQWEYACRAGTNTSLNTGKNITNNNSSIYTTGYLIQTRENTEDTFCPNLNEVGWFREISNGQLHPVGLKKPNAWGIYDMHGNVREWCYDYNGDYPTNSVTDPINNISLFRITRGGSIYDDPKECRSASRRISSDFYVNIGFRVALVSEQDKNKQCYYCIMDDMVQCPAGSFMMGSPENELGHNINEFQHKVTISKPFYIGKYEVTQELYETIMDYNPSYFEGDKNPVESITWFEAKEFCEKLNTLSKDFLPNGYKFDLPTEEQWEYACRAGTNTSLNSGINITYNPTGPIAYDLMRLYEENSFNVDKMFQYADPEYKEMARKAKQRLIDVLKQRIETYKLNKKTIDEINTNIIEIDKIAWFNLNSKNFLRHNENNQTQPVGLKIWNKWLIYDMHGNVGEWCKDSVNTASGSIKIVRGGGWNSEALNCRSAARIGFYPNSKGSGVGFRLALVPVE